MKNNKVLSVSSKVEDGNIVTMRNGKIIRCGRKMKPCGVFTKGYKPRVLTLDCKFYDAVVPSGIIIHGFAHVKTKEAV